MITVTNLKKSYYDITVLNIPGLHISKGESFGLVGNNGAGKTTFFSLILDLIKADSGAVTSKEKDVKQSEHWKSYTGSYLDEGFLIDFLTPEEYFEFLAKLHGKNNGELKNYLDKFRDFFNYEILDKNKYIRELSKGNQKKVGIAAALMFEPEILILDEPFPNLDPSSVIRLKMLLKELKRNKEITILISSHDLNHVTEVCERIVVLNKGNIIQDIQTSETTLKELEEYFRQQIEIKNIF